jgi:hypothetical protein
MLSGDIPFKVCPNVFQCYRCDVDQRIQDELDRMEERMMATLKVKMGRKK